MRWTAATPADADRVRAEAAKASDAMLPEPDRRTRAEPLRIVAASKAVDAMADIKELDAVFDAAPKENVRAGDIVYYLGDHEARVVGLGRGRGSIAIAFRDESGDLSYTEVPAALCKHAPAEIRDGVILSDSASLKEAAT